MDSVATGDGHPERSGLSRSCTASETPPGVFLGAGLAELEAGRGLLAGMEVSEEHLARMLVEVATDPVTGTPLGSAPSGADWLKASESGRSCRRYVEGSRRPSHPPFRV